MGRPGKGYGGPWWGCFRDRICFERGVRAEHANLEGGLVRGKKERHGYRYALDVLVPRYETEISVEIIFRTTSPLIPRIFVDGPEESPHRYPDGRLCIWYADDPDRERVWVFDDGLLELIDLIRAHLFKEAWWRQYGEWLGPQVLHGDDGSKA